MKICVLALNMYISIILLYYICVLSFGVSLLLRFKYLLFFKLCFRAKYNFYIKCKTKDVYFCYLAFLMFFVFLFFSFSNVFLLSAFFFFSMFSAPLPLTILRKSWNPFPLFPFKNTALSNEDFYIFHLPLFITTNHPAAPLINHIFSWKHKLKHTGIDITRFFVAENDFRQKFHLRYLKRS